MGYTFAAGDWMQPAYDTVVAMISDELHALLVKRANALAPFSVGSDGGELAAIADAIKAYEAVRWPNGRTDGGKG
jgi:hypothetical protein